MILSIATVASAADLFAGSREKPDEEKAADALNSWANSLKELNSLFHNTLSRAARTVACRSTLDNLLQIESRYGMICIEKEYGVTTFFLISFVKMLKGVRA